MPVQLKVIPHPGLSPLRLKWDDAYDGHYELTLTQVDSVEDRPIHFRVSEKGSDKYYFVNLTVEDGEALMGKLQDILTYCKS